VNEEEIVRVSEDGREIWLRKDIYDELKRKARKEGKTVKEHLFEHMKQILREWERSGR